MKIKNIPLSRPSITEKEIKQVTEVLMSGHLTTGLKVTEFEENMSNYLGKGIYSAGLNSCTAGLYLSLLACGVGEGDEVIVPTWTFAATAHVVYWTGAKPVLCDVKEDSLNLDETLLERLVTPKTKVIIPVHFAGFPCEMDSIMTLARNHNLYVIEDAAHAIGTKYKGKNIGAIGDATVFSFYATKNLACGEGGMVVSKNKKLIQQVKKTLYFGINKEAYKKHEGKGRWFYDIESMGYKFNLDNIHAAIGLSQLEKLDPMNERRRYIAHLYKDGLDKRIVLPKDSKEHLHSYHLFYIRVDKSIISRDELALKLQEKNIGSSVHFIPLHKHSFYQKRFSKQQFPVADRIHDEVLSIPMFPDMSNEDVAYVIENINGILRKAL
ncbi:MAG: DegT/DnrJ/EryC1/StrS aminotransferase family protein [Nitrospinae bacterium]|nr:DegT/DnrJ/EryC1/StrS aminotransferase family protein [Nitrospinota bacterium]